MHVRTRQRAPAAMQVRLKDGRDHLGAGPNEADRRCPLPKDIHQVANRPAAIQRGGENE